MEQGTEHASVERLSPETAGSYVGTLFDDHGTRVFGLCRLILRDPVEAEDAAQQTFLSAYRSLLSGHSPRDPPVWLSAIARNECLGRLRTRAAEQPLPIAEQEPAGDDVTQIASRHEQIDELRDALSELTDPQREAIVLREFYGLSYEEVGEASGLTTSAVKSALFRARKALKRRLRGPRELLGVAVLPVALRDSLTQLIPGFSTAEVGAGPVAKALTIPLAAKIAGATTTVAVVGVLGGAVAENRDLHLPSPAAGPAAAATLHAGEPKVSRPLPREPAPAVRSEPAPVAAAPAETKSPNKRHDEAAEDREAGAEVEAVEEHESESREIEHEASGRREPGEGAERAEGSEDD